MKSAHQPEAPTSSNNTIPPEKQAISSAPASRFSPRTLVNIGVFSAIYFVVTFATGMLGFAGPGAQLAGMSLGVLINGTVIMLYLVKTRTFGALTILGLILGTLFAVTGHVWYTMLVATGLGLIGDILVRSGGYRSKGRNILAYGIFTLWYVTPLAPIFYQADEYFADVAQSMNSQAYADSMRVVFQPWLIVTWGVVAFFLAIFAAWVGTKVLEKHFVKAGIV